MDSWNTAKRIELNQGFLVRAKNLRLDQSEKKRLEALHELGILDSAPEEIYDDLALIAATICELPIAAVSMIDEDRQWFKSSVGIEVHETPREISFCTHTIKQDRLFQVSDTTLDERFANNPLVIGDPKIRFYAGISIKSESGHNVGAVCVVDREPHELSINQRLALESLGRVASSILQKRTRSSR